MEQYSLPMALESEHNEKIVKAFNKVLMMAIDKQHEL